VASFTTPGRLGGLVELTTNQVADLTRADGRLADIIESWPRG